MKRLDKFFEKITPEPRPETFTLQVWVKGDWRPREYNDRTPERVEESIVKIKSKYKWIKIGKAEIRTSDITSYNVKRD